MVKRILCIRLDNMGDVIMSGPAMRALKETFEAHITLLTSSKAAPVTTCMPWIDETLIANVPWVQQMQSPDKFPPVVETLRQGNFDMAVIFTVYSQNPLPAAMMAWMAGIPLRVAYCRENPYQLLTHWVPEQEPYRFIRHQVRRDLDLVASLGASTAEEHLTLCESSDAWNAARKRIGLKGPWIVLHPGVSDPKRQYPFKEWVKAARMLKAEYRMPLVITGNTAERAMAEKLCLALGQGCYNLAGKLETEEFICLIRQSKMVITVNTGTAHIAAATQTPVLVLYALTNPQHTPWKTTSSVLYFDIPAKFQSRNDIIRHVYELCKEEAYPAANLSNILQECQLLMQATAPPLPFAPAYTPAASSNPPHDAGVDSRVPSARARRPY